MTGAVYINWGDFDISFRFSQRSQTVSMIILISLYSYQERDDCLKGESGIFVEVIIMCSSRIVVFD